jgi:valyl-tRNA synthetase
VNLAGLIDVQAEVKRLGKQVAEKEKQLRTVQGRLANADYLARAPADVVAQTRQQAAELEKQLQTLRTTLAQFQGQAT